MLKIIGRVTIPRVTKRGIDSFIHASRSDIQFSEVVDVALRESYACVDEEVDEARRQLVARVKQHVESTDTTAKFRCGMSRPDGSLLLFRNVTKHADKGNPFRLFVGDSDTATVRSATLGVVLRGTCFVRLYKGHKVARTVRLKAGDVYVLDQSVEHEVSGARKVCVHLSVSMTLAAARCAEERPGHRLERRMLPVSS
jgi:hypothetical protein